MIFCWEAIWNYDSNGTTTEISMKDFGVGIMSWPSLVFCLYDPIKKTNIEPTGINITLGEILFK